MKKLSLELDRGMVPLSILFFILIYFFRNDSTLQYELVILAAVFYVSAALLHHHFDKSLTFEIVAEYILIAALALIILQGLLI